MALAGRAVGGQVSMIILRTPDRVLHKFVQKFVRRLHPAGALHRRVHRNGRKVCRIKRRVRLHQHVLETEDGKARFVLV